MMFSKIPAYLSASLLGVSLIFSFWRDILETALFLPTTGGIAIPNSLTYDGLYAFGWAIPLFLAVSVSLGTITMRGTMTPAVNAQNPHKVVNVIIGVLIGSNILAFILAMVTKYGIPQPPSHHHGHGAKNAAPWTVLFGGVAGRAAMPAFYNVGWSLVTAMRHPTLNPIQSAFGLSYEHTIVIHRTLGWLSAFWLTWHAVGYTFTYAVQGGLWDQLDPSTTMGMFNLTGLIAFVAFAIMAISSLPQIRRPRYSIFAVLHWLWIAFFFFSIFHIPTYFLILLPPLFLYLVDRLAFLRGNLPGPTGAKRVVATLVRISDDAFAVLIPVGMPESKYNQDQGLERIYTPGRFVSLALADDLIGLVPSHPFSIAAYSAPNQTVCIIIRALGPWTKRVHGLSTTDGSFVNMLVAGPFSSPALSAEEDQSHPIVVAGGIGVSKYLGYSGLSKDIESKRISTEPQHVGRKVWLCKESYELDVYASLGADLTGWDGYCKKGFQSSADFPKSFPLSAQPIQTPLSKSLTLVLASIYFYIYVALYMASRYTFKYDAAKCAKVKAISQWILCGRGYGLVSYAYIMLGIPIASVIIGSVLIRLLSTDRPNTTFICHSHGYAGVGRNDRRFDLAADMAWPHADAKSESETSSLILRSCTSKPVRDCIRTLANKHNVQYVNDGIGF